MQLEQYILRFDMAEVLQQVEGISDAYTDLGKTIRAAVDRSTENFGELHKGISQVNADISNLDPSIQRSVGNITKGVEGTTRGLGVLSQQSLKVSEDLKRLQVAQSQAKGPGVPDEALTNASDRLKELAATAAGLDASFKKMKTLADADLKKAKAKAGFITKSVTSELKSAKSAAKGLLGNVPGGVFSSGSVMGGLIGAMVLGYTETDRLKFWSGEVLNVFEATGDSLDADATKNIVSWFSNFQNNAHHLMGISKEEIQATLKSAVDAGYKVADISKKMDMDLGYVGENVGVATIALDKHFNLQTGTTMKNAVKVSQDLGGAVDENTKKLYKLSFAAQRSGMGVLKYVDAVMSGASAVKQYGIELSSVADMMQTVQDHYSKMGLNPQYAGAQAAQVVSGMTGAISNMPEGVKGRIAKKLSGLSGIEALQWLEDGFKRIAAGSDDDLLQKFYKALYDDVSGGGKSRATSIELIAQMTTLDRRSATTLYDLAGNVAKSTSMKEMSKDELKAAREAFKTEGDQISDLAKLQFNLRQSIAKIGQGLIKILTSLVGVLALLVKGIPMLIANWESPTKVLAIGTSMGAHMDAIGAHLSSGVEDVAKGLKRSGKHIGGEFGDDAKLITNIINEDFDEIGGGGVDKVVKKAKDFVEGAKDFISEQGSKKGYDIGGGRTTFQKAVGVLGKVGSLPQVISSLSAPPVEMGGIPGGGTVQDNAPAEPISPEPEYSENPTEAFTPEKGDAVHNQGTPGESGSSAYNQETLTIAWQAIASAGNKQDAKMVEP